MELVFNSGSTCVVLPADIEFRVPYSQQYHNLVSVSGVGRVKSYPYCLR